MHKIGPNPEKVGARSASARRVGARRVDPGGAGPRPGKK